MKKKKYVAPQMTEVIIENSSDILGPGGGQGGIVTGSGGQLAKDRDDKNTGDEDGSPIWGDEGKLW